MSDALGFLPDTKPDVAEPWRKVLLDAADYIEAHGWWRGKGGCGPAGERCAIQAIKTVLNLRLDQPPHGEAYDMAARRLRRQTGAEFSVASWNDEPGRTASEVTAALRACARQ